IYILDNETGINAFSAGFDVSNSVIVVTQGTLDTLDRDELQGVIGHEFSHILNGDVRINIRMMGVLAGLVAIGSIGLFAMRNAFRGRKTDVRVGLGLFVAGGLIALVG